MSISGSQSLHGLGLGDSLAHETSPFSQSNSSLATGSANFNGMTDGQTALSTGRSVTNSSHLPYTMSPNPSYSMQANAGAATSSQVVPVGFEEGTLRALCDLDCGFPLLMDRTKQSMASCREASTFLKKRAAIEEEYGRALQKLSRERNEAYRASEGKPGTFQSAFTRILTTHDTLGDNRIRVASQMNDMAEQLNEISRETERQRKLSKDLGGRYERALVDAESQAEKCRNRFDSAVEELERVLLSKAGENARDSSNLPHDTTSTISKGRTLGKAIGKLKGGPKNAAQIQRLEEEARLKTRLTSDAYRQQVLTTQQIRQEYFNLQLPKLLKSLKEALDEIDLGTQFHLSRYAYLFESLIVSDGITISPPSSTLHDESSPLTTRKAEGLKSLVEKIDNSVDFKSFMQNYAVTFAASGQRVLRREGPPEEGFVRMSKLPPAPSHSSSHTASNGPAASTSAGSGSPLLSVASGTSTQFTDSHHIQSEGGAMYFGVDLGYQMQRDGVDIPKVLEKCTEVIEQHGLAITGLYRLSGTTSRIQRLKAKLEKDVDAVDLRSDDNLSDINDITGVLKLFFRELPEPLFTHRLYHGFIEAARIENSRLRHIRLHERINDLPDPNYATCKFFLGHLDKVQARGDANSMTKSNLAIVFGPTLLGPPPEDAAAVLQDMQWQCKAIETILDHYAEIFIDLDEEGPDEPIRQLNSIHDNSQQPDVTSGVRLLS